ncbi:hypothetical protein KM043_011702 [Ampulex compressa]|nr:hypothetical protein KM043_011702 [Ampulex compressa]
MCNSNRVPGFNLLSRRPSAPRFEVLLSRIPFNSLTDLTLCLEGLHLLGIVSFKRRATICFENGRIVTGFTIFVMLRAGLTTIVHRRVHSSLL